MAFLTLRDPETLEREPADPEMDEQREQAFAASIEDVDFFIDRFRKRASGPRGERFQSPLNRLLRLKERLVDLRISTSELGGNKSKRGRPTDVLVPFEGTKDQRQEGAERDSGGLDARLKSIEESLRAVQQSARAERSLEQRFAKLNLTMSAILDSLSERQKTGVDSRELRAAIGEALKDQSGADPERLEKILERLEGLELPAPAAEPSRNGVAPAVDGALREAILEGLREQLGESLEPALQEQSGALKDQSVVLDEHGISLEKLAKRLEDVSWLAAKGTENAAKLDRVSENLAKLCETIEGLRQEVAQAPAGAVTGAENQVIESLDTAAQGLQSMLTNILGALANVPRPRARFGGGRRAATQPVPPGFEVEPRKVPFPAPPASPETMRTQKMSPEAASKAHRNPSGERRVVKMPPPPGTGRPFGLQSPGSRTSRTRPIVPPKPPRRDTRKTIIPAVIEGAKTRPRPQAPAPGKKSNPARRRTSESFRFNLDDLESSS